ncbi:MAG TPA: acyl-CoA dehydrogenase family protein [Aliidongia sp.]|nr:acyl-CoA dehydrogenase family protein [Aliidongia sp.]
MAPDITSRAGEIEALRQIPSDLVETLRSIGVFRLFVPRSLGGLELDLPAALGVIEALAKIDGSIGWTVMISNGGSLFRPSLPPETYARIYRDGPDVITAGSTQPAGTAEAEGDGWRVTGRWPFASGCRHADWIVGFCVVTEGGKPLPGPNGDGGPPLIRGFLLPASDWEIEDTWRVAGLKGTGSHHIAVKDKLVSEANFFDPGGSFRCHPGPLYQAVLQFLPLLLGAVTVGIAEGALDDLVALAGSGRQQFRAAVPMRESEIFQYELGRIAADVKAAKAMLETQAASHWRHALAGTLKDEALITEASHAAVWVAATCTRAADACFAVAGSSSVYETSPLQRRLRDCHVASQHGLAQQRLYVGAGKQMLNSADSMKARSESR